MVRGSKTEDEFKARMRDAGYEDWEIAEEIEEQRAIKAKLDAYTKEHPPITIHEAGEQAKRASAQLQSNGSEIASMKVKETR